MKRISVIIFVTLILNLLYGQNTNKEYQIISVQNGPIVIGETAYDKDFKKTIKGSQNVAFVARQSMWVKDVRTGIPLQLSYEAFQQYNAKNIDEYLVKLKTNKKKSKGSFIIRKRPSTKGANNNCSEKIAWVIGNSNYNHIDEYETTLYPLRNTQHDAEDVSVKLSDLGFDVYTSYDLTYQTFKESIEKFVKIVKDANCYKACLFYYTGHGIQCNQSTYLIPIDITLRDTSELKSCIQLNDIITMMDSTQCPNCLMFFDACRDIKGAWQKNKNVKILLPAVKQGQLLMFSTSQFGAAHDYCNQDDRNSPFANSFLSRIMSATDVSTICSKIQKDVKELKIGQIPDYHNLLLDYYLNPSEYYTGIYWGVNVQYTHFARNSFGSGLYLGYHFNCPWFFELGVDYNKINSERFLYQESSPNSPFSSFYYKQRIALFARSGYTINKFSSNNWGVAPFAELSDAFFISSEDNGDSSGLYASINVRFTLPKFKWGELFLTPGLGFPPIEWSTNLRKLPDDTTLKNWSFRIQVGANFNIK